METLYSLFSIGIKYFEWVLLYHIFLIVKEL
jgi:hypothetical protein